MVSAAIAQELYAFGVDRVVVRIQAGRMGAADRSSCGGLCVPRRVAEQGRLGGTEAGK